MRCPFSAAGGIKFKSVLIGNSLADENTYRFVSEEKQAKLAPQARRECTNLFSQEITEYFLARTSLADVLNVGGYHKGGVEFPPYEIMSVHDL